MTGLPVDTNVIQARWGERRTFALVGDQWVFKFNRDSEESDVVVRFHGSFGHMLPEAWDELDAVTETLVKAHVAKDPSDPDFLEATEVAEMKGRAQGLAYAIVLAMTPFFKSVEEVSREAGRRYKAKQAGTFGTEYITNGFTGSAMDAGDLRRPGYPEQTPWKTEWEGDRAAGSARLEAFHARYQAAREKFHAEQDADALYRKAQLVVEPKTTVVKRSTPPPAPTAGSVPEKLTADERKAIAAAIKGGLPVAAVAGAYKITPTEAQAVAAAAG